MPFRGHPAPEQELEDAMTLLALEPDEREAFAYLVRRGDCTAGDIARLTGLSRANAYKILRTLVAEGLVKETPGRPLVYTALDLKATLLLYSSMAGERARRLEELATRFPPRPTASESSVATPEDISVYVGRAMVSREMQRIVHAARHEITIYGSETFAQRLLSNGELLVSVQEAMARGIDVHVQLPAGPHGDALLSRLGIGSGSRHADAPRVLVLCVTDRVLLAVLPQPDDEHAVRGDDLGIKVSNAALARAVVERLEDPASEHTPWKQPRRAPGHRHLRWDEPAGTMPT